jgi:signal recognition particle subunit SRP54
MFAGIGEKLDALEQFHPDRMAKRILGMGDVVTLIEKAQESAEESEAEELEEQLRKGQFTLEDFQTQMAQIKKMGGLSSILGMMPGAGELKGMKNLDVDESQLDRVNAIIQSMTPKERRDPKTINGARRSRIAAGSGTSVQEVNQLLKQFQQAKKLMKQMTKAGGKGLRGMNLPPGMG